MWKNFLFSASFFCNISNFFHDTELLKERSFWDTSFEKLKYSTFSRSIAINFNIFPFNIQIIDTCRLSRIKKSLYDTRLKHSVYRKCSSKYFTLKISVFGCACGYEGEINTIYMFKCWNTRGWFSLAKFIIARLKFHPLRLRNSAWNLPWPI